MYMEDNGKCYYDIYAASNFSKYGFAPTPINDTLLLILEISGNSTQAAPDSIWDDWIPQPHDTTPYLKDTTSDDVEATPFCSQGKPGYAAKDMSQCNIVHGREGYPFYIIFQ